MSTVVVDLGESVVAEVIASDPYTIEVTPVGRTGPTGFSIVNIDGGTPASNFGGIATIDAGGV